MNGPATRTVFGSDVRPVVEELELRLARDRGVDRLLPRDARLPEVGERLVRCRRPVRRRLARDLPLDERGRRHDLAARHRERRVGRRVEADVLALAPAGRHAERRLVTAQRRVQPVERRLDLRLMLVVDDVDLRVVGDRLQRDVRHALVDEAVADIAVRRLVGERASADFGFLAKTFRRVGEQVVRIPRAHDARARERERHARRVDRDPATTPLLGDVRGRAGTAGRIEHEVARIGRHQEASLDDRRGRLNDVDLVVAERLPIRCRSRCS